MSSAWRWILVLAAVLGAACTEGPAPTAVQGTVTELASGAPVAGATAVLVDVATLAPGSRLARTDARGRYRLEDLVPGDYALLLIHDYYIATDRAKPLVHVESGRVTQYDVTILGRLALGGPRYRITGTVKDAATGRPVAGAFVEPSLWALSAQDLYGVIAGVTVPEWGTTDERGRFSIRAFVTTDERGRQDGLAPITVIRAGYEPFTLVGRGRAIPFFGSLLPLPADSTLAVTIRLRPAGASAPGGIRGRVIARGTGLPVPGIRVGLSLFGSAHPDTLPERGPSLVPVQGKVAVTDASGAFRIEGLGPGRYVLAPAYLEDDGYAGGSPWIRAREVEVADSDTAAVDAGDVEVLTAVRPIYPADRSTIRDRAPELRWEPFADGPEYHVIAYDLTVSTGFLAEPTDRRVADPRWQAAAFPPGTRVQWWVSVLAVVGSPPDTVRIAEFERPASFTIAAP